MYLPYPGFFQKLSMSDVFVLMDDVQYDKRYTNRNQILVPQGPIWISVPIDKGDKFSENRHVRINNSIDWRAEHLQKIDKSYARAPFFHQYGQKMKDVYSRDWEMLLELDLELVKLMMDWLGLKIPTVRESELGVGGESTERLVNACKAVGADTYVSGIGGKNYMDESMFARAGLSVVYQHYEPVEYKQRFGSTFVPNLSIVDMVFNVGPESSRLIRESKADARTAPLAV